MNRKNTPANDPLVRRVEDVAQLVMRLRDRVSRLEEQLKAARQEGEEARNRLAHLESERGEVRQRVHRMLETIHE